VLRRSALAAIGGIVEGCDTEDQVTTIALLRKGFITRYLGEQLSIGLAPESIRAMVEQRRRWARGALQILFRRDGPFGTSMTLVQRIFFLQSFWFIGQVMPIVFALAPLVLWLGKVRLFPFSDPAEVMTIPIAAYVTVGLCIAALSRRLWWPLVTPASQLFVALRTAPTSIASLLKPYGKPLTRITLVTPKGQLARGGTGTDWATLTPVLLLAAGILLGMLDSILRDHSPIHHPYEIVAALWWTGMTLLHLTLAGLACVERPYVRSEERFALEETARLTGDRADAAEVVIEDLSLAGARLRCAARSPRSAGETATLAKAGVGPLPCEIVRVSRDGRSLAVSFRGIAERQRTDLIRDIYLDPRLHAQPERFSSRRLAWRLGMRMLRAGP
jgi:cellulose synthase (UDP-forming)